MGRTRDSGGFALQAGSSGIVLSLWRRKLSNRTWRVKKQTFERRW
jgi:hypothetical protein